MAHPPPSRRIVLFGGTFDPVHHAHLITAQAAREALTADQVLFIPARQSPHKTAARTASADDRLAMLRLAIAGTPAFAVTDLELTRPGPSYTIDTVEALRAAEPAAQFILLMGADQLAALHTWHRAADLLAAVGLAVLGRPDIDTAAGLQQVATHLGAAAADRLRQSLLNTPLVAISATEVRARVAAGLPVRYLVPDAVAEYISQKHLYAAT